MTSAGKDALVVEELSRQVTMRGTSQLTVRLALPSSEAWPRVRGLFAAVREADEVRGEIEGRVLGVYRPMLKLAQQVGARFEERASTHATVTFTISVRWVGRGMDSKIFDDIVTRLREPGTRTIALDWYTKQMLAGRSGAEALAIPLGVLALVSQLVYPVFPVAAAAAERADNFVLVGVVNGLFLSDVFLLGPVLILVALVVGAKLAGKRRWGRAALLLVAGLVAGILWLGAVSAALGSSSG